MVHLTGYGALPMLQMLYTHHQGGNTCRCGENFPQHLVMPGLSTTDQSTKADKELIRVLKHPGPKPPFTIGENLLHAIDILAKLFNTMQPDKTQIKGVPREVRIIGPPRVHRWCL